MEIEGRKYLPTDEAGAILVRYDNPISEKELADLSVSTGMTVFSLSDLFRFQPFTWKPAYWRFLELASSADTARGMILVHDLHREVPLNILINVFLRRWIRYVQEQGWPMLPGVISSRGDYLMLRLGKRITREDQQRFASRDQIWRFLLTKARLMDSALELRQFYLHQDTDTREQDPLIDAVEPAAIRAEIAALPSDQLLTGQAEFDVWLARAEQIPHTLREIGRLREITFREVGEGTGKELDLDEYDLYYEQLIIWDREAERIAGGYRIGRGDKIFQEYGVQGFYVDSLFKIKKGFYSIFPQAMELGRSYIVPEYQKKRLPLFLLWKGILALLLANPQYRYLYGPVSISKYYSDISKSLIIYFVRKYFYDHRLARYLKPRKAFAFKVDEEALELLTESFKGDLDQFNSLIEDIEPEHVRIPVLMRQYIRQNAKFIAFNLDPNFSDVLDGFILLDLHDVPQETLEALQKEKMQG
ncbi:MAG: GNAT family N-acetyltransferase [Saprospiraceae bacterium]